MPQCEAKGETIDMKMIFYSHADKTHLHKKGFALSLVLKVRVLGARKGMAYRPSCRGMKLLCTNGRRDSGMKCAQANVTFLLDTLFVPFYGTATLHRSTRSAIY